MRELEHAQRLRCAQQPQLPVESALAAPEASTCPTSDDAPPIQRHNGHFVRGYDPRRGRGPKKGRKYKTSIVRRIEQILGGGAKFSVDGEPFTINSVVESLFRKVRERDTAAIK